VIRHRWLLLSIFVAALLIVLAIVASKRTVHSGVTIAFVGYTNLPNSRVRSAIFAVHNEHPSSMHIDGWWLDAEGLEGHNAQAPYTPNRLLTDDRSGGVYSGSFAVDEPLESGRWRASMVVYHAGLRETVLFYAAAHGLMPLNWFNPLLTHLGAHGRNNYVTNSSIWLTRSP
jgi:hypothetical protein